MAMSNAITPNTIKQTNRNLIYQYIYDNGSVTQQELVSGLSLSRPTISSNITDLEENGMIKKNGLIDGNNYVGRKASVYSIVRNYRVAIGAEIQEDEFKVACVNLYGEYAYRKVFSVHFSQDSSYFNRVCDLIRAYIAELGLAMEQLLGISIAVPALVSVDGTHVTFGKILNCTGLSVEEFTRRLRIPCRLVHDAASAALLEMWRNPSCTDALYLLLSYHLGACIVSDKNIVVGKHGHSATVEHIHLHDGTRKCYCGKVGCVETELSMVSLLDGFHETLDQFFENAHREGTAEGARWRKFLEDLADLIHLLHLVWDTDYILGGILATYFTLSDIQFLRNSVARKVPFEEEPDFIHISEMAAHSITVGGALTYIKEFLDSGDPL